jgi:parvulin-like peptidyl-prolyl isomerase
VQTKQQTKRLVALILGAALVLVLGGFVVSGSIGDPSVSDGDVAVVDGAPDSEITQEEFDAGLEQAAFNLSLQEIPDPERQPEEYAQVREASLSNLIQTRWVRGEAEERGITVSERDVQESFDQIVEQQLGGQKGYERFLEDSPFDEAAVQEVAELSAISSSLQEQALPATPEVSESEVQDYYEANSEQFEQPETRDVRVLLNPDEEKVEEAKAQLEQDSSEQGWEKVAKRFSTDDATKNQGGLRSGVTQGQNEPALDEAIFTAPQGELLGPITAESGSYLIQVESVTPAQTTPLEEVSEQITQALQQGIQTQATEDFRTDFSEKWGARTFCADDYVIQLCANAEPPADPCATDDDQEQQDADQATLDQGCPAPAGPRNVISPGTGGVLPGQPVPALPQLPCAWLDPQETDQAPCAPWPLSKAPPPQAEAAPGGVPIGPDGAPLPGGAAPPQGGQPAAPPGG